MEIIERDSKPRKSTHDKHKYEMTEGEVYLKESARFERRASKFDPQTNKLMQGVIHDSAALTRCKSEVQMALDKIKTAKVKFNNETTKLFYEHRIKQRSLD